jgi:hypothetical protein
MIYLTAIGLTLGHVYTNNTQNTENGTYITNKKVKMFEETLVEMSNE